MVSPGREVRPSAGAPLLYGGIVDDKAIRAYPINWPAGWPRTESYRRKTGQFTRNKQYLSVIDGVERVLDELKRLGVERDDIVVSTNIPTRLDGLPRSDKGSDGDPGAAVYWRKNKKMQCMAIDRYNATEDNLAAIAATLDAMRAIQRHGGGEILDRAFTGFIALPAPEQPWQVLGVGANATPAQVEDAYRKLAAKHHPDRGGSDYEMARINAARDALMGAGS